MIHGPEHPLVVRLLYEDPVTADTIRGVVPESLLHRHADVNAVIQNKTEQAAGLEAMLSTFHFFLLPETLFHSGILPLSGSVQATDSVPEHNSSSLFSSLSPLVVSDILGSFFFPPQAFTKCLPAGYGVRSCHPTHSGLWGEWGKIPPEASPCEGHLNPTHQRPS